MKMPGRCSRSKLRTAVILFFTVCLCFVFSAQRAPAEAAAGTGGSSEPIDGNAETVRMMNLNLRYILNTWWPSEKDYVYAAATGN